MGSASGDRGQDRDDVAGRERGVKPPAVADVVRADEEVHVPPHRARLVADGAVERREAALELVEGGAHARGLEGELGGAVGVAAQRRRYPDGHGLPPSRRVGLVSPARLERTTCSLGNCRSIQLSYGDAGDEYNKSGAAGEGERDGSARAGRRPRERQDGE